MKEIDNSGNVSSKKTVHSDMGDVEIRVSKDRKDKYKLWLVSKH